MRRGGTRGGDPTGPTTPEDSPDEFLNAYSDLKTEILDAVKLALEEHFTDRASRGDFSRRMDGAARRVASLAYEQASGVEEFMKSIRRAAREVAGSV